MMEECFMQKRRENVCGGAVKQKAPGLREKYQAKGNSPFLKSRDRLPSRKVEKAQLTMPTAEFHGAAGRQVI